MAKPRSTNRTEALKLWIKSGRTKKLADIADELGVSDVLIRKWKHLDQWDNLPAKRPRGAPKGNQNAVGNKGGAPPNNDNAVKHGLYRKYMPDDPEFQELLEMAEQLDPLDMYWQAVKVAYAKMMWAQRVMFVKDHDDMTKEVKKEKSTTFGGKDGGGSDETEWNIQFAWDKQAVDIRAFTAISRELRSAIRQFLAAAPENDERRLKIQAMEARLEQTKAQTSKLIKPEESKKRKLEDLL